MTEQEWTDKLKAEGFTKVFTHEAKPTDILGEHTHDQHTAHVILDGELVIEDASGTHAYRPGDYVEFPAGTKHTARTGANGFRMIVAFKE
jgi:quercetin dioxygenase-like cupin family protein